MDEQTRRRQRLSFGPVADIYDEVRPSYPVEAVRWAVGDGPVRVIDLGAGTGLLTQVLVELGHQVTAVEPDPQMRAQLEHRLSGCAAFAGSAEEIPTPDAAADAVVAGHADHWFDPKTAHAEIARVLRPGGIFAPMWNLRDESVPWVARLSQVKSIVRDGSTVGTQLPSDAFGDDFGSLERREFTHSRTHTAESLLALLQSRSWYLTATEEHRAQVDAAVQALTAELPSTFELPYLARVYRASRR